MNSYATRSYTSAAVHTTVDAATPHQLILMLFDGALRLVRQAKTHLSRGEIGPKATCITKAIDIIDQGLRSSLDEEGGGEIAKNLAALYDYALRRLVQANMHSDPAMLDDVLRTLEPLREAWRAIAPASARTGTEG